jgi:hypothetical protein
MSEIRFDLLGPDDYERAKTVLNRAKHPGFVGRELYYRCATQGRVCVAVLNDVDVGVAMIAKDKLAALSVISSAQGGGVGAGLIAHLKPRWASVIGERVKWFEKRGYKCVGAPKVSQNGKHATQLMERDATHESGDAATIAIVPSLPQDGTPRHREPIPEEEDESPSFLELLEESPEDRAKAELAILDGLMAKATRAEKFSDALKILDAAQTLLRRHGVRGYSK